MANKTLYVSEQDEHIWTQAVRLSEANGISVSQLAADGLRAVLKQSGPGRSAVASKLAAGDDAEAERMTRRMKRLGFKRYFACVGHAAAQAVGEWREAKRKAEQTLGPQGRSAASKKANKTIAAKRQRTRQPKP